MTEGAFQGIKVVEFGHFLLVPIATAIMADLGADVIKVENPRGGEPARFPIPVENVSPPADIPLLWFHQFNRGKRSLALDVNKKEGRELLYELVEKADVFATNFDPRFVDRAEADYDTLSKINPGLIYCQCTGAEHCHAEVHAGGEGCREPGRGSHPGLHLEVRERNIG